MRIKTGIPNLDKNLQGGFLAERVYLLSGPPGSGKTTMGMQFLSQGAKDGELGLFISLVENPMNIIDDMSNYNFQVKECIRNKKLYFMDMGPLSYRQQKNAGKYSHNDDRLPTAGDLLDRLETIMEKADIKRIVIDSAMTIKYSANSIAMQKKELTRFVRSLKDFGCTTILISEMDEPDSYSIEHFLCHGVIFMHNFFERGKMFRAMQIIKMRGTKHDCYMHEINFTKNGISYEPEVMLFD